MRKLLYDAKAPKQTVSITVNADLYARAKSLGINASKVAEEGLAAAYCESLRQSLEAEIKQDLAAASDYAERHGSFADLVRDHYDHDAI